MKTHPLLTGLMLLLATLPAQAEVDRKVPVVHNFANLALEAGGRHLPIMLVVSQTECGYCERLKSELLEPMRVSGDYDAKVIIRELNIDAGESVTDFNGVRRSAQDLASDYRAWVTPTLLFLDPHGKLVADRIRGYNTPDLFPGYVDEAIDKAHKAVMVE
ncbi:MAG: thioredoxin fold domain-containing protein [Gammaproteobacteria bacterium]|nr:thioredoxin fold domain-containing protein [Gammaproteobacteria bacterium]MCP5136342.1 thioredoxin fold domain-containing protein [Gammaproteobacteria bacterium]